MKIIHRGIAPTEKTYRCTCSQCKTRVEFRADDAEVEMLGKAQPGGADLLWWPCPVCKQSNSVRADQSVEDQSTTVSWYDR